MNESIKLEIDERPVRPELIPDAVRRDIGQAAFEAFRRYLRDTMQSGKEAASSGI